MFNKKCQVYVLLHDSFFQCFLAFPLLPLLDVSLTGNVELNGRTMNYG